MNIDQNKPLYLALIHYPAVNRRGKIITATVEAFDFYDISRISLTYPITTFFIVNPLEAQKKFALRLLTKGCVREKDVKRRKVFSKTEWQPDLETVIENITNETNTQPLIVATSAKRYSNTISFGQIGEWLQQNQPILLLFGKAWGMPPELVAKADYILESIDAGTGYNHLSVRSAVSIIVDRIFRKVDA